MALMTLTEQDLPVPMRTVASLPGAGDINFDLLAGFYLLPAGTAGGKSINSYALASWAGSVCTSHYVQINEPGAQEVDMGKLRELMKRAAGRTEGGPVRAVVLVIDSLGSILEKASAMSSPTMKGGLTMSAVEALRSIQTYASHLGLCFIGTINSDVFPVQEFLEGVTQGKIIIEGYGELSKRDRGHRAPVRGKIPAEHFERAKSDLKVGVVLGHAAAQLERFA